MSTINHIRDIFLERHCNPLSPLFSLFSGILLLRKNLIMAIYTIGNLGSFYSIEKTSIISVTLKLAIEKTIGDLKS